MATRVTSDAFIGRRTELAELERAFEEARDGRATLAFVAGESGVGKSRLAAELARRVRAADGRVLVGDCVELGDSELPYAPIVSALRPLARSGDPVLDELGAARGELASLLPELGASTDLRVEPVGGTGQGRMFELLLGLLDRLGRERPVLLTLEDLHWADRSTREFIAFLARNLCAERVLLVATYRSDELHRRHPLRPLLAEVQRSDRARRIALERFTREELAALLEGILDDASAPALLDRLWRRSEGNPLFAEELLAAGRDGAGELPASLRDALMLRVEALSQHAQDVLRWIAAGRRVEHEVLADVAGLDERTLRDALREGIAHHVIVGDDTGYAFRHALLREVVHDDLLPGERGQLHSALARALEKRVDCETCVKLDVASAIAHHFDAAGDQPRALAAAVRAGGAAERVFASGEAAALYERALELWDRVQDAEQLLGMDHVELLERASLVNDDRARAVELLKRALAEVDRGREPRRAALLLGRLGHARWGAGKSRLALEAYDEALALLAPGEPSEERATVLAHKAAALTLWGRYRDGDVLCDEALTAARAAGHRPAEIHALNTRGLCRMYLGEPDDAVDDLRRSLAMAREDDRVRDMVRGYINLSDTLHYAGRTREAYDVLTAGLADLRAKGYHGTWTVLQQAEMAYHLGRWEESGALLRPDLAVRHQGMTRVFYELRRAELELARGEHEAARARLQGVREQSTRSLEPQWHAPVTSLLAVAHLRDRDVEAARAAIDHGLERLTHDGAPTEDAVRLARVLATAATVEWAAAQQARDLGHPGDEAEAAARAADFAARTVVAAGTIAGRATPETAAHAAVARGAAAAAAGHDDPGLWAEAVTHWRRLERPYRVARCLMREADARLHQGDRAGAERLVAEAHAIARGLGAEWLAGELEGLARRARLRLDAEPAPEPGGDDGGEPDAIGALGLTPREREVLALVAQGRTNREIGELLYMAEKTASVHVSRILGKLGVRTRTEAAAVAHRLGLEEPAGLSA